MRHAEKNNKGEKTVRKLSEFLKPATVEETVELLIERPGKRKLLAGGTGVSVTDSQQIDGLIDLTGLELDYIEEAGEQLALGAVATMRQLESSDLLKQYAGGVVAEAAANVGTTPLRNMITLGGSLAQMRVWADLPPVFLAVDAEIVVSGPEGEQSYSAVEFFSKHPTRLLDKSCLIKQVNLDQKLADYRGNYEKFAMTSDAYATVTVTVLAELNDGIVTNPRIAIGSASPFPTRCTAAEEALEGQKFSQELAVKAGKLAREEVKTTDNVWGSASYKSKLIEKLVKRNLLQIAE